MAQEGSAARPRVAAELLLLHRLPRVAAAAIVALVAAACCATGAALLVVQHHFAADAHAGRLASVVAHGSTALTAWEGWFAGGCFAVAVMRLRRAPTEPPAGRIPVEQLSAAQLRAGLVREYTVVRAGLVVVAALALVDAARAVRYGAAAVSGDTLARGTLAATIVEALGLVVAAALLALWAATFRSRLEQVGALQPARE